MPHTRARLILKSQFAASHRLYDHNHDDEWNLKTYGRCSWKNGHGHNYVLEVFVEGEIDPKTGMVMNTDILRGIVKSAVLDKVDHLHLNHDVDFLKGVVPTMENVAQAFWDQLDPLIPNKMLSQVRLWETEFDKVEIMRK